MRALSLPALLCGLLLCLPSAASAAQNPVITGDYPDLSAVRSGHTYYAVATSKNWAPAFPVLRSSDLVNWRQISSVLPQPPRWATGGFWAPEISKWGRTFRVYYGARRAGGGPCIALATARDPRGPWRDRGRVICNEQGALDAYAVRDSRGLGWLVWKRRGLHQGIFIARLNRAGTDLTGRPVKLIEPQRPWEEATTEAPNLVRRDGWWYLIYSGGHCCRPPCTYQVGVARSRSITGPYVRAARPALTHSEQLRCVGHGSLLRDVRGREWYLSHGYETSDVRNTRRQGILTPVTFDDGWPRFGDERHAPLTFSSPFGVAQRTAQATLTDGFSGGQLRAGWQWHAEHPATATVADGKLRLRGTIARLAPWRTYTASAKVRARGGLHLIQFDESVVGVTRTTDRTLRVWRGAAWPGRTLRTINTASTRWLTVRAQITDGISARFSVRVHGRWRHLGGPIRLGGRDNLRVALASSSGFATIDRFTARADPS